MPSPLKKSFAAEYLARQRKKKPWLWVIVGIVVVVIIVVYALQSRYQVEVKQIPETEKKSIAVLPFYSLSDDKDDEYFSYGITDDIITYLQRIRSIEVRSFTSILQYTKRDKSLIAIAQELGVDLILEGSVRRSENRVRIIAQLIDAKKDINVWGHEYERENEHIFEIQSDIARTIADTLKIELSPSEKEQIVKHPTDNIEAYNLYLQGRFHWNKRTKEGFEKAIDYFQQAIDKDSNYALAYSGMADSYSMLASYGYMNQTDGYSLAKEKAEKALEIDDMLAEAHTSLAYILAFGDIYKNRNDAEIEFIRALELNPGYATAHKFYSALLRNNGQHTEALEEMKRALELNPLSLIINADIIEFYGNLGRYDEAREQFKKTIELDPNFSNAYQKFGDVCIQQGNYKEAEELLLKALEMNPSSFVYGSLGYLYNRQEKYKEAEKILLKALEMNLNHTWIYYRLGETYNRQGKYKEAEKLLLEATEMYPNGTWFYVYLGEAYIQQGKYKEGIDACNKAVEIPGYEGAVLWAEGWLGHAYVLTGERDRAEKIIISLKERKERVYTSLIWIANIYMALEENDTAFEWLQKAFEEDVVYLDYIEFLPEYDNFRSDPKCMALLKKMGIDE